MEKELDATNTVDIAASLRATMAELVAARAPQPGIVDLKRAVRSWQNRRFAQTYADLAQVPRYQQAVDFFLHELYADVDMTARDADMVRVLPVMIKLLPDAALQTMRDALAFEALSEQLDTDLARKLRDAHIDTVSYGEAFRACGQREQREQQVRCVQQIGWALDRMTRLPLVGTTLKLMRAPARAAGLDALQEFLEGGYSAFKHIHGADWFLATIARREAAIIDHLFAGHPAPFDLEDAA